MPNNLTDAEIKKALECCVPSNRGCEDCPFNDNGNGEFACIDYLQMKALDLINRKEEENKSLQAENERLEEENRILKRDNHFNESGIFNLLYGALVYTKTFEDYNKFKKCFKAEAYKEFAEEIENINLSDSDGYFEFKRSRFDNLLKELVGDGGDR